MDCKANLGANWR